MFTAGTSLYYQEKNGEKVKLRDSSYPQYRLIAPENADLPHSLKNQVYLMSRDLFYLDDKLEMTTIAIDVSVSLMHNDLKTLYYVKGSRGSLYRTQIGSDKEPEKLAENIGRSGFYDIAISDDQRHIYFLDKNETVHYLVNNNETKAIASNVYHMRMADDGWLYFTSNTSSTMSLSCSFNGGDSILLDDEAQFIFFDGPDFSLYAMRDGSYLCALKGGQRFTLLDNLEFGAGYGGGGGPIIYP